MAEFQPQITQPWPAFTDRARRAVQAAYRRTHEQRGSGVSGPLIILAAIELDCELRDALPTAPFNMDALWEFVCGMSNEEQAESAKSIILDAVRIAEEGLCAVDTLHLVKAGATNAGCSTIAMLDSIGLTAEMLAKTAEDLQKGR